MYRRLPSPGRAWVSLRTCHSLHTAAGIMCHIVALQDTAIRALIVGDRKCAVLAHDVQVEINHASSSRICAGCRHSMRRVTGRAGEAIGVHMIVVIRPGRGLHHDAQIMTLGAHAIRSVDAEVGLRIQVDRDQRTRTPRGLAVFVIVFQQVPPLRAMRSIWS